MLQVHLLFTLVLSKGLLFRFEKALDKGPVFLSRMPVESRAYQI